MFFFNLILNFSELWRLLNMKLKPFLSANGGYNSKQPANASDISEILTFVDKNTETVL